MINRKPDHDNRNDHDHDANDNGEEREDRAIAPAPAGGALASLAALGAALNSVDTASVGGRSGLPMLQFKRDGDGTWIVRAAAHRRRRGQPLGRQPDDVQVGLYLPSATTTRCSASASFPSPSQCLRSRSFLTRALSGRSSGPST